MFNNMPSKTYKYHLTYKIPEPNDWQKRKIFIFDSGQSNTHKVLQEIITHLITKFKLKDINEFNAKYAVTDVKLAPLCHGCIYEHSGLREHMDCNNGCMHDPDFCYHCAK